MRITWSLVHYVMRVCAKSSCHIRLLSAFHSLVIAALAVAERADVAPASAASHQTYSLLGNATDSPHETHALLLSELQQPADTGQQQRLQKHGRIPTGLAERMVHHGRTIMSEDQALQV